MAHQTQVPGIQITQAQITDNCRKIHGALGAFDEACRRLRVQYENTITGREENDCGDQTDYHLALTVNCKRRNPDG